MVNPGGITKNNRSVRKIIPYGHQWIERDDIKEVVRILQSDYLTQGPQVKEFESALSSYTGSRYAVATSSGTAALHAAIFATGVDEQDEVITSPLTFAASANCILYAGAKPVFADIQRDTANIDPQKIKEKINRRTRVLLPVHFAGHPADLEEISKIARRHQLLVIEDAAHALGAEYRNSKIGSGKYSDLAILSFHPVKHITTGEGGAILTNNKNFYEKLLMFREHGITKNKKKLLRKNDGDWYYEQQLLGFNYRLTDFQSALGLSQLKKLEKFIQRRREIVRLYHNYLEGNDFFDLPQERDDFKSSWHLYPVRLKDKYKNKKKKIFAKLRKNGLGVQVHYIPVYWHPYYHNLGYKKGECPEAEDFYQREISLPLYPKMTNQEIKEVVNILFKVFRKF